MTKILSIIFVPIIFFLFYFSVIFLTYTTKPEKDKLNTDLVSNTDYKLGDSSSGKQNFSNENLEIIDQEKNERKNIGAVKDKDIETRKFNLQFGAFKSIENARKFKNKINEIFNKEFGKNTYYLEIINIDEHSKIILPLNSLETAKKLCEFSKRNNINCIILNL